VPYPIACPGYGPSVVREVARAVLAALEEPADARLMFASSPRVPPRGEGWRPLPFLTPRVQSRLPGIVLGRSGGGGLRLLRCAVLTLANLELVEVFLSPMSTSRLGRIRFVRVVPRGPSTGPIDLDALIPDFGSLYRPERG
jgi:hypothetical protein